MNQQLNDILPSSDGGGAVPATRHRHRGTSAEAGSENNGRLPLISSLHSGACAFYYFPFYIGA